MCNNCERIFDESIKLKDNAMLKVRPELFYEWDFEKNDELGLDVYKVTKGSKKVAWWYCSSCGSHYDKKIESRVISNQNCPYCAGKRVNHTNSLTSLNPQLASEWHPTKNDSLTPNNIACKSGKKFWWKCSKGHEWEARVADRNYKGYNCPYCSNKKVLKGFNDMWTTNPELAKLLANPDDGYKYTQGSVKKVDWKCSECGQIIKNKSISNIRKYKLVCPNCSDGKSYPEKILYHAFKHLNINFECEKTFGWSKGRRYDFYLPYYNMIIEINGMQHYSDGFKKIGGRTLKEEIKNDKLKMNLAKENDLYYVVIDARYSDINYIKSNLLNSELARYFEFNRLDWAKIEKEALSSLVLIAVSLWNKNFSTTDIKNALNISRTTAIEYLKKAERIGLCFYKNRCIKECVQISSSGFVKMWSSISKASKELNLNSRNISSCCSGRRKTAGGYKWMYKEDYDKLIHNQEVC